LNEAFEKYYPELARLERDMQTDKRILCKSCKRTGKPWEFRVYGARISWVCPKCGSTELIGANKNEKSNGTPRVNNERKSTEGKRVNDRLKTNDGLRVDNIVETNTHVRVSELVKTNGPETNHTFIENQNSQVRHKPEETHKKTSSHTQYENHEGVVSQASNETQSKKTEPPKNAHIQKELFTIP